MLVVLRHAAVALAVTALGLALLVAVITLTLDELQGRPLSMVRYTGTELAMTAPFLIVGPGNWAALLAAGVMGRLVSTRRLQWQLAMVAVVLVGVSVVTLLCSWLHGAGPLATLVLCGVLLYGDSVIIRLFHASRAESEVRPPHGGPV